MQHKAMHCLACGSLIPLWRRFQGHWYCSEVEYRLHTGQRHVRSLDFRRDLNPMRCSCCRRPIPLLRRVFAMACCSHACTRNMRFIRGNPAAAMTLRSQDGEPTGRARLTRAAFAALLLGGVGLGRRFGLGSMLAWSPAKQASHDVSFANWIRYTELREEIRDWSGPGPGAIPWRIESGWMQPIGTLLYQQVPQALTGVLSLRFSLADDGVARILLGVDRRAANLHMLEVVSSNAWLTLRAFRLTSGARTPIAGDLRMERLNRSLHDLRVQFNGQAIHATLNNHPAQWSNLHLRPGRVGLAGSPDDRFRVYQARLSLDA